MGRGGGWFTEGPERLADEIDPALGSCCWQVRSTEVNTPCAAAPLAVRLPPDTLRLTTAGALFRLLAHRIGRRHQLRPTKTKTTTRTGWLDAPRQRGIHRQHAPAAGPRPTTALQRRRERLLPTPPVPPACRRCSLRKGMASVNSPITCRGKWTAPARRPLQQFPRPAAAHGTNTVDGSADVKRS